MRQFTALKTISLILGFTLVTLSLFLSSCATTKKQFVNEDFELTAGAVSEGILLTFNNIPPDTSHMWISVIAWDETKEPSNRSFNVAYAGITDTSVEGWVHSTKQLEKIKQTGKVIFPIVQTGQKYYISATIYNQQEYRQIQDVFQPRQAETECIAENGIHFDRDLVKLELNNDNSTVTLSSEPVFSSEVMFDIQKYTYGVTIIVSETESVGVGDHHIPDGLSPDGLAWTFEPQMTTVNLRGIDWLKNGNNYPARSEAYANIIYDNILWSVEIAKTPDFTFTP